MLIHIFLNHVDKLNFTTLTNFLYQNFIQGLIIPIHQLKTNPKVNTLFIISKKFFQILHLIIKQPKKKNKKYKIHMYRKRRRNEELST